ncbi:MAG: hypothetical protein ORN51_15740 [Akkermansiaceae bacterium]|nr:hypothetical protein [Akkermansiaceae bacterium]
MDPIHTWLDPAAVRELADRLLNPSPQTTNSAPGMGFNDSFVGFEADPSTAAQTAPVTSATFAARLNAFADWLHQDFAATGIFILDDEGALAFSDGKNESLHSLARSLVLSRSLTPSLNAPVHLKIAAKMNLVLIPTQATNPRFLIAALMSELPISSTFHRISENFPTP